MNEYNIYTNPLGKYNAVKQGWSWIAFLLFWIYALYMNKWKLGLLTLAVMLPISIAFVTLAISIPVVALIPIGIMIWFARYYGKYGHIWREEKLIANGFEHIGAVQAQTEAGAIAEHMRKKI
ncbi:MAG: hypothetical protein U9N32_00260 [Spirochaetota bacterium]|nr:hypothetical protein [Spirochaetota bacterium]